MMTKLFKTLIPKPAKAQTPRKAEAPKPRPEAAPEPKAASEAPEKPAAAGTGAQADFERPKEIGGPEGPEPTRYGDWERGGRCFDF